MTGIASFFLVKDEEREDSVLIAVPKKGRLYEPVMKLLLGCGFDHTRQPRLDVAKCHRSPVTLVFLPAADIASYVGAGDVDLGITGEDIIAESGEKVDFIADLEMGKVRLCLQAPIGRFKSSREVAGKRIVTSFPNLAKKFFAPLDAELGVETKIKYVSGSVEVACGLGLGDAIIDLVETGTTMKAAGLEVVDVVMTSKTVLIGNPQTKHRDLAENLSQRIKGYLLAQGSLMISYNINKSKLLEALAITPGHESATIQPLHDEMWVAVSALINKAESSDIMDKLQALGGKSILLFAIQNCRFPPSSPVHS